jgi:enoyl-CoA hydratase/carnithine racemase
VIEWPDERIWVLRLNRPAAHNALSRELLAKLRAALVEATKARARVLILSSSGPSFCSGADLKERRGLNDEEKYAHNRAINAFANELAALPLPTIAEMRGSAFGGGLEVALACDIRFAAVGVKLGLTEARIGAIPGAGGTQRLPRLIGAARALEMMYGGEPVQAEKAAEWGLVNAAVSMDQLADHTLSFARLLAGRSRRNISVLKRVVYDGLDNDLAVGLDIEGRAIIDVLKSRDYQEGLEAFAEKRAPNFE